MLAERPPPRALKSQPHKACGEPRLPEEETEAEPEVAQGPRGVPQHLFGEEYFPGHKDTWRMSQRRCAIRKDGEEKLETYCHRWPFQLLLLRAASSFVRAHLWVALTLLLGERVRSSSRLMFVMFRSAEQVSVPGSAPVEMGSED